jgi:hypothetical protein
MGTVGYYRAAGYYGYCVVPTGTAVVPTGTTGTTVLEGTTGTYKKGMGEMIGGSYLQRADPGAP